MKVTTYCRLAQINGTYYETRDDSLASRCARVINGHTAVQRRQKRQPKKMLLNAATKKKFIWKIFINE